MGLLSKIFGGGDGNTGYTIDDEGTDHDLDNDDMIDGAQVYYTDPDDDDPNEYDERNSSGFTPDPEFLQDMAVASVCGVCGHQVAFDDYDNPYCGCGYADDYDD